jgi:hypothetical protein
MPKKKTNALDIIGKYSMSMVLWKWFCNFDLRCNIYWILSNFCDWKFNWIKTLLKILDFKLSFKRSNIQYYNICSTAQAKLVLMKWQNNESSFDKGHE